MRGIGMRARGILGVLAAGAIGLLIVSSLDGSDDSTTPDGDASGYVSDAPLPGPPSINLKVPGGELTDCTPQGGTLVITVINLDPSAIYKLRVRTFEEEVVVMSRDLEPGVERAEVSFDCKGKAKGHYGVLVTGAGRTATDAFDVYTAKPKS